MPYGGFLLTRSGHHATALALAIAGSICFDLAGAAAWAIGCILGASAPDYLEIPYGFGRGRRTLLRHRTITHQPLLWMTLITLIHFKQPSAQLANTFILGWAGSSLLHILMDLLTPVGTPLGWPWGKRTSIKIFRTGGTEWPVIGLVWLMGLCFFIAKASEKNPKIFAIFYHPTLFRSIFSA